MKMALLPGVIAGLFIAVLVALQQAQSFSYGLQELLGLSAMALGAGIAQWLALRAGAAPPSPAFAARYFTVMITGAATAVSFGLASWLDFAIIEPDHLQNFYAQYLERASAQATTETERAEFIAAAERMKDFILDPLSQATVQFGTLLMISLLTGLVVAAIAAHRHRR